MEKVLRDVANACAVVHSTSNDIKDKIYYSSNENLDALFQNFSVKDKDVLTVLASSDQLFYSYYNGAKKVDSFDRNGLTKYYYYLRVWFMKYYSQYYPKRPEFLKSVYYLEELLSIVQCETDEEKKAYSFWDYYVHQIYPFDHENLFLVSENDIGLSCSSVLNCLNGKEFSFEHENLASTVNQNKKYDIIITSNIFEYLDRSSLMLQKCHDNLKGLLKEDGMIVCSHFINDKRSYLEKNIFDRDFNCSEFPLAPVKDRYFPSLKRNVGYSYTLKC